MPLTSQLGTALSRPENIQPGLGSVRAVSQPVQTSPPSLVVEIDFVDAPVLSSGYFLVDLNDSPVAYWRLDNATSCLDQSGSGNTLTVEGAPTLVTSLLSGDTNQATQFNGTSQDAYAADSASLSPTGAFSIEGLVRLPSIPAATRDLVAKRGSYLLQVNSTGHLLFTLKNGTLTATLTSTAVLSANTTYHVACVYDGTNLRLYLNGTQDASTAYTSAARDSAAQFVLARQDKGGASPTLRSYSTNMSDTTPATLVLTKPTGTADGDALITNLMIASALAVTPPDGWILLGQSDTASAHQLLTYGKVASGEPGSWTWTFSSTSNNSYAAPVACYTGVAAQPFGSSTVVRNGTWISNWVTTVAGTVLPDYDTTTIASFFGGMHSTAGPISWTESAGTENFDSSGPTIGTSYALNTSTVGASSSQTNTGTASVSGELFSSQVELVGSFSPVYTSVILDEVSFFGFALTAAQVLAHYNAVSVAPPPPLTWVDVSADVRALQVSRGRQYELNRIEAGTCTVTLKDTSRNYDPGNTLGVYNPNVLPMRRLRVRATFDNITYYPIFQGYIERWPTDWNKAYGQNYEQVTLTAVDGFEPLAYTVVSGTVPASQSGVSISSLLTRANWAGASRTLDTGAFALAAIPLDGTTDTLSYIQQIATQENGVFFIDASGNAVFHDKNHRSTVSRSTTSQATFADVTSDGSLPYSNLVPSFDKDHIVNDWKVIDSAGASHTATDTTSINTFFHRSSSLTTQLAAADATTMASYLLGLTKNPGYRFDEIEIRPLNDQRIWLQALQREISDRITVKRQAVGTIPASQIVKDCWIEKVTWNITAGQPWTVSWQLSPAT